MQLTCSGAASSLPNDSKAVSFQQTRVLAHDAPVMRKLQGSVVIICGTWHEHSYGTGPMVDVHDSPAGVISGAFVHENYYEAMIQGHYFDPLSDVLMDIIEVVLILASAALMLFKKSVWLEAFCRVSAHDLHDLLQLFSTAKHRSLFRVFDSGHCFALPHGAGSCSGVARVSDEIRARGASHPTLESRGRLISFCLGVRFSHASFCGS